jgi:hypothetical protein
VSIFDSFIQRDAVLTYPLPPRCGQSLAARRVRRLVPAQPG